MRHSVNNLLFFLIFITFSILKINFTLGLSLGVAGRLLGQFQSENDPFNCGHFYFITFDTLMILKINMILNGYILLSSNLERNIRLFNSYVDSSKSFCCNKYLNVSLKHIFLSLP